MQFLQKLSSDKGLGLLGHFHTERCRHEKSCEAMDKLANLMMKHRGTF